MARPYPTLTTFPEDCCCTGPTIDSLTPGEGSFLGGTTVTITGSGFIGVTSVTFNGVEAASFVIENDFTIVAVTAPATDAALGLGDVVVTDDIGSGTLTDGWTYSVLLGSIEYWLMSNWSGSGSIVGEQGVADLVLPGGANNPTLLYYDDANYFYMPSGTVNRMSVPDSAVLDIAGDMSLVFRGAAVDWTHSAAQFCVGKFTATGNQRSYRMMIDTSGRVVVDQYTAGTAASIVTFQGTVSLSTVVADNDDVWFGASVDVDDGGGNRVLNVWWSTDGITWTLLETVTTAGVSSAFVGTGRTYVGSQDTGGTTPFIGKIYRAQIYSGAGFTAAGPSGTLVFDADAAFGGQTSYTEQANGATVTINRNTTGAFALAYVTESLSLAGADDWLTAGNVTALNFGTGDFAVANAYRSHIASTNALTGKTDDVNDGYGVLLFAAGIGVLLTLDATVQGTAVDAVPAVSARHTLIGSRDAGVELELFVDGVSGATSAVNTALDVDSASEFRAGRTACEWYGAAVFDVDLSDAQAAYLHTELS